MTIATDKGAVEKVLACKNAEGWRVWTGSANCPMDCRWHGGTLVLECSEPRATTFVFSLPNQPVIARSSSG